MQLWDYSQEMELPIIFSPVCVSNVYVEDPGAAAELRPTQEQLHDLKSVLADDVRSMVMPSNVPFWKEYFGILDGQRRQLPCFLLHHYASVSSDGTMRLCPQDQSMIYGSVLDTPPDELWYSEAARQTRRRAKELYCPTCTVCCDMAFCFSHEFFYYARFLVRDRFGRLLRRFGRLASND
jgi:hypothetical protein